MDFTNVDRKATCALAWIGDAELALFVREALLYAGLKDTLYFQEFTSRAAHAEMFAQLTGKRCAPALASELLEAAFASDESFRLSVERLVIKHISQRTSPRTGSKWEVMTNPSGRVVSTSCQRRYGDFPPTFINAIKDSLEGYWVKQVEAARLAFVCTIEYVKLVLEKRKD